MLLHIALNVSLKNISYSQDMFFCWHRLLYETVIDVTFLGLQNLILPEGHIVKHLLV